MVCSGRRWARTCIPVLLVVVGAGSGRGIASAPDLNEEYLHQAWTKVQGLPGDRVQALLQTHDGYLWVGTHNGLARFDGLTFRVFDRANTPAILSDDCRALVEDGEGTLWVGTGDGLLRYQSGAFAHYQFLTNGHANAACPLAAGLGGGVWVARDDHVLLRLQGPGPDGSRRILAVPIDFATCLQVSPSGVLWVGTARGVYGLDASSGERRYGPELPEAQAPFVRAIQTLPTGEVIAVFTDHEAHSFLARRTPTGWVKVAGMDGLNLNEAPFIVPDRRDGLWVSGGQDHLLRWDGRQFRRYRMPHDFPADYPMSVCVDREGGVWFGAIHSGLHRLRSRVARVCGRKEGLPADQTWAVCQTHEGSVWIGTQLGLSRFAQGRFNTYTIKDGLSDNPIKALLEDGSGALWVGTGNGLDEWRQGRFIHHRFLGPGGFVDAAGKGWNKIRALLLADDGSLYAAIPRGVRRLYAGGDALRVGTKGAYPDVRALLEDRSGAIWLGTDGDGVSLLSHGGLRQLTSREGLLSDHVWTLYQDREGVVWIGTEHGLNRYRDERLMAVRQLDGLWSHEIISLVEDDHGWFWIGSERGLYRVRKAELDAFTAGHAPSVHSIPLDEGDGCPPADVSGRASQPAAIKAADGRLWFCTSQGVVVIDPAAAARPDPAPPVVIEQVRANDRVVFGDALSESTEAPRARPSPPPFVAAAGVAGAPRSRGLRLAPGQGKVLEFHYTANTFAMPAKARFRYRLEGYERQWHDVGTRRVAYYTNLSPGDYRFHVLAANHHGFWNDTGASLAFYLAPFFYQTWAFRLGSALVALVAVLALFRWRLNQLGRIEQLERQVALSGERSRIARDLHDGLGAGLTQLQVLAAVAERDLPQREAAEAHLRHLASLAREVSRMLRDIVWLANSEGFSLEALVSRICGQAEQLFQPQGVRCRFEVPTLPSASLAPAVSQAVYLVAKEALNNAAKHARASEVRVAAECSDGTLSLVLEDNGCGFDPAAAAGPPAPAGAPLPGARSRGLGLTNMRQRLEAAGGAFELVSAPGRGTQVRLRVPLPP